MKLRLRSLETKQTHRIDTPNPCSLLHLKQLLSQSLSVDSSIHLSLNRRTELVSTSPDESIQSLGVTSGDLVYFTTNPNAFSSLPAAPPVQFPNPQTVTPMSGGTETLICQPVNCETLELDDTLIGETLKSITQVQETVDFESAAGEISDKMEEDIKEDKDIGKSFSVPGFLRKVFTEELGDDVGRNHKLHRDFEYDYDDGAAAGEVVAERCGGEEP